MENVVNKKRYLTEANIFRGIFCIYVLLIHCTGTPSRELMPLSLSSIVFSSINTASKGAVPAFIFVSGLAISYSYVEKNIEILPFYKKRIKNTLIPYVIATLFYYGVYINLYNYEFSIPYLLDRLITGNMVYHLYFMIIIMQFYIVYPIICKLFKKFNNNILMFVFFIIHIICYIYIPMKYRFFGNYILYFTFGCYFAFNYEKVVEFLEKNKVKYISMAVLAIATTYYIVELYLQTHFAINLNPTNSTWQIFSFITIPAYYIISIYIDKGGHKFTRYIKESLNDISKVSLSIYLLHPCIIIILQRVLVKMSIAWRYVALTTIVLALALLYSKIIKHKNKVFKYIKSTK